MFQVTEKADEMIREFQKDKDEIPPIRLKLFPSSCGSPTLQMTLDELQENDETFHEHPVMPHIPRIRVQWDEKVVGLSASDVDKFMAEEDPPVDLRKRTYYGYYTNLAWRIINPFFLREGEEKIVAERLRRILTRKH